ncbi:MAG: Lrp/AsnC ligand binding domain-containing protein [Methanimicrococcus sp.]|nr:Lrp/AsnC ligand binding domain-containing protein [Methanimicrococcus sp.]
MVIGVTMLNVLPGSEKKAYNDLKALAGVKDVYHVFGEFDFVVIAELETLRELNDVVDKIRENQNVTATQTIVGAEL